MDEQAWIMVSL